MLCAAGDKTRAVAAYEGKFIVRFGAKNSRFPQVSAAMLCQIQTAAGLPLRARQYVCRMKCNLGDP